jgi:hypothetical protein
MFKRTYLRNIGFFDLFPCDFQTAGLFMPDSVIVYVNQLSSSPVLLQIEDSVFV